MLKKIIATGIIGMSIIGMSNNSYAQSSEEIRLKNEIKELLEGSKTHLIEKDYIGNEKEIQLYNAYFDGFYFYENLGTFNFNDREKIAYKMGGELTYKSKGILDYIDKLDSSKMSNTEKIDFLKKIKSSIKFDKTEPYLSLNKRYGIIEKGSEEERIYRIWENDPQTFVKLDYEDRNRVFKVSSSSYRLYDELHTGNSGKSKSGLFDNGSRTEIGFHISLNGFQGRVISDGIERIFIEMSSIDGFGNFQSKEGETFTVYIGDKKDLAKIEEIAKRETEDIQKLRESGYTNDQIIEHRLYERANEYIQEDKQLKSFYDKIRKENQELDKKIKEEDEKKNEKIKEKVEEVNKEVNTEKKTENKKEEIKVFEKDGGKYEVDVSKLTCSKVQYVLNNFSTNYFNDSRDIVIATFRDAKVINGVDGVNFEPKRGITRAEFLVVLMRALCEEPEYKSHPFKDVIKGHWTEKTIGQSYGLNWIQGYSDGTIRPNGNISKLEVLYVLHRLAKIKVLEFPENFKLLNIEEKMKDDITKKSVYLGLIKDQNVNLNDPITREEMMHMLKKLFGVMSGR